MKQIISLTFILILISCNEKTLHSNQEVQIESKDLTHNSRKLWKNGKTLKVLFLNGSEQEKRIVREQALKWTKYANLNFKFYSKDELSAFRANIKVAIGKKECGKGNWSKVGTDSNSIAVSKSMCLSSLDHSTILHEFGHAIGLEHEQHHSEVQELLSDKAIELCMEEQEWSRTKCEHNYITGDRKYSYSEYDSTSIMHYSLHSDQLREDIPEEQKSMIRGSMPILSLQDRIQVASIYPGRLDQEKFVTEYSEDLSSYSSYYKCNVFDMDHVGDIFDNYSSDITSCEGYLVAIQKYKIKDESKKEYFWSPFLNNCYESHEDAIRKMYRISNCKNDPQEEKND